MRKKKAEHHHRAKKTRPSWSGALSFGLVTFPVEAFNALDREGSDIHFHQIHAKCHRRIHYQKICPVHGEVSNDEIVSGYEYKKGKIVELEREELKAIKSESDRALKIDAFVSPETIDPLYFDGRMYYLVPDGAASHEPYAVILKAMESEDRYGIGHLIFSGKDQIALVRPLDGILHMAMLNYDAEIRPPKTVARAFKKPTGIARQVRLAQTLIEEWSQDGFDFSKYEDTYREKVKDLIESKVHGHEIVTPAEEEPRPTLNLMEALKRSVGRRTSVPKKGTRRAVRRSA